MDEDFSQLPIDDTLTVHTAPQRGYQHVLDIDQKTLRDLLPDVSRMVREEGYKLGRPRYIWPDKGTKQDRGLYEPLHRSQGESRDKR